MFLPVNEVLTGKSSAVGGDTGTLHGGAGGGPQVAGGPPIIEPGGGTTTLHGGAGGGPQATGAAGTVVGGGLTAPKTGVAESDATDAAEVPTVFVAVALNVYAVPFVRPVTTQLFAGTVTVQVRVTPPTCGVALTKNVTGIPPVPPKTLTVT